MRNYKKWRQTIRDCYSDGRSSARNRGPWSNPGAVFRLPEPGGVILGPGPAWPHFGKRNTLITLTISETYSENSSYTLTYKNGDPSYTRTITSDRLYDFNAAVPKANIRAFGTPFEGEISDVGLNNARIRHASATPYGEGLYDCRGDIQVQGTRHTIDEYFDSDDPTGIGYDPFDESYGMEVISIPYESDETAINGRNTPCMMTAGQKFAGPNASSNPYIFPAQPFLPYAVDEFGYSAPDGSSVEVYFTPTFLSSLINGVFGGTSVRNSNGAGASESYPDPIEPIDTSSASESWSRTGEFTLSLS